MLMSKLIYGGLSPRSKSNFTVSFRLDNLQLDVVKHKGTNPQSQHAVYFALESKRYYLFTSCT